MTERFFFEDLSAGQTASPARTMTEAAILSYSLVSMDTDPRHLDAEAAKQTYSGGHIAHGMLSSGLISAVPSTKPPGPSMLCIRRSPRFASPANNGQTVRATMEVTLNANKKRGTSGAIRTVGNELPIEGEAYVQVPSRG
jgi:3-hydroxybutyryl-CoA dehydratase